jgi:hypothetical protein
MGVNLKVPQQEPTPLTPGANSPQQSAFMKIQNMNTTQAAVNSAANGGKRRKKGKKGKRVGGGNGTIQIPPTSTASYNVNGIVKNSVSSDLTSQSNAEYDSLAYKKGGSKKRKTRRKTRRRIHKKTRRHRR